MWLVLLFLIGLVLVNQTHFRQRQNLTKHKEKHKDKHKEKHREKRKER